MLTNTPGFEYSIGERLLLIDNVSLTFGDNLVLREVNAQIDNLIRPSMTQGQVVSFLGPSGIGKTQLFRIMAGLQQPTSGQVLINATGEPVRRGLMGVVAQHYPLFAHRTVLGNLVVAGKQAGLSTKDAREKAHTLLERFGLNDRGNHYPAQLSGGQRQRIAIAQQLMCSEHFLLMDEPFSGLDPVMKDEVCELVSEVASLDERTTIVVITHDIGSAVQIADHVWLMGRDRDGYGQIVPGARIQESHNLIDRGLAWRPGITTLPEFTQAVREFTERFKTL